MIFEYCETCQKVSYGGYFASATKDIKVYLCRVCNAITYIDKEEVEVCSETWNNDYKLRNESVELQDKLFSSKYFRIT